MTLDKVAKMAKKGDFVIFTCHKKPRIFKEKFNFVGGNMGKNMKIPKSSTLRIKKVISEMQKSVNNVK